MKDDLIFGGKIVVGGVIIYGLMYFYVYLIEKYLPPFIELWEFAIYTALLIIFLPFMTGLASLTYTKRALGFNIEFGFGLSWLTGLIYILITWFIIVTSMSIESQYLIYINISLVILYSILNYLVGKLLE
jgi:hypothetical protein